MEKAPRRASGKLSGGRRGLAERVLALPRSATVEMTERIRTARASGRRILSLSSGDPQIETDARIVEAAYRAMREGDTRYVSAPGVPALRAAIAEQESARTGRPRNVDDVLITPGGKFALLVALMSTVGAGDEVIVPEPGWVSYSPCVQICGATPRALPMLDVIDIQALERAINPRTAAIILNSPVNPTGRVIPEAEITEIVALAERYDLWIIFDQVYAEFAEIDPFPAPQRLAEGELRCFVVDSFSKTFGMTGWRLGYLMTPPRLAKQVVRLIQHSVYCVPGFVQAAGIVALSLRDELAPRYRAVFRARQARAVERLSKIPGIRAAMPDGGFYVFPYVDTSDARLAEWWLDTLDVSSMPGSAFGKTGAGHLRLSLTSPDAEIDEALDRIARAGIGADRQT